MLPKTFAVVILETNALGNIQIKEASAIVFIDPKIYPLELVYSASYIMIDKAFIVLGGNPDDKIAVEIRPKKSGDDINRIVMEFNEELLNYAVYKIHSERNKDIKELILQRVLMTNAPENFVEQAKMLVNEKTVDDPENIMEPWNPDKEPEENVD